MTACSSCPMSLLCLEHGFKLHIPLCQKCQKPVLDVFYRQTATHPDYLFFKRLGAAYDAPMTRDQAWQWKEPKESWPPPFLLVHRIETGIPVTDCPCTLPAAAIHATYPCPEERG
jgi:hypothetical protein